MRIVGIVGLRARGRKGCWHMRVLCVFVAIVAAFIYFLDKYLHGFLGYAALDGCVHDLHA